MTVCSKRHFMLRKYQFYIDNKLPLKIHENESWIFQLNLKAYSNFPSCRLGVQYKIQPHNDNMDLCLSQYLCVYKVRLDFEWAQANNSVMRDLSLDSYGAKIAFVTGNHFSYHSKNIINRYKTLNLYIYKLNSYFFC